MLGVPHAADAPVHVIAVPTASARHPLSYALMCLVLAGGITAGGYAWQMRQDRDHQTAQAQNALDEAKRRATAANTGLAESVAQLRETEQTKDAALIQNAEAHSQLKQARIELDLANRETARFRGALQQSEDALRTSATAGAETKAALAAAQQRLQSLEIAAGEARNATAMAEQTTQALREAYREEMRAEKDQQSQAQIEAQEKMIQDLRSRIAQQQTAMQQPPPIIVVHPVIREPQCSPAPGNSPPPRLESVPARPDHHAVWVAGNWTWNGADWIWMSGTWSHPQRVR